MHHLAAGVYTGIGSPGTQQGYRRIGHSGQRLFQCLLDTEHAIGLTLPATVA
ncbi:hypothetical protein D9M70_633470 [compost metagenome]